MLIYIIILSAMQEKPCKNAKKARKIGKKVLTCRRGCAIVCITCRTRGVFFVRIFCRKTRSVPYREAMPAFAGK